MKDLLDNFRVFKTHDSSGIIIADKLSIFLNKFRYCKIDLSLFKNISRFQCLSFIDELEKLLIKNNNDEIEKIFSDEKYKALRDLWGHNKSLAIDLSVEGKKEYLRHFKIFLILHNQ